MPGSQDQDRRGGKLKVLTGYLWISEDKNVNPLNAGLNHICHLLALSGAHHILHISGVRANILEDATEVKIWDLMHELKYSSN